VTRALKKDVTIEKGYQPLPPSHSRYVPCPGDPLLRDVMPLVPENPLAPHSPERTSLELS